MKIEVTKFRQEVEFSTIAVGECFDYDGNFYMKTILRGSEDIYETVNSVRLDNGQLDAFCSSCNVIPIKATLQVMRKE